MSDNMYTRTSARDTCRLTERFKQTNQNATELMTDIHFTSLNLNFFHGLK